MTEDRRPRGAGEPDPTREVASPGPPAIETGDEPPTPRRVAPGGWRRAVIGLLLGAAAGVAIGLVVPRDEGPRRSVGPGDRPRPLDH